MAAADDQETLPAPVIAVDSAQAAGVVQLRGDQSPLPAARLFGAIAPAATAGGTAVPGHPADIQLTATLSPAPVGPPPWCSRSPTPPAAPSSFPLSGTLPADGRPHQLTAAARRRAGSPTRCGSPS